MQFVSHHQHAHNELSSLDELVAETKKVANLMKGITDSKLEPGKSIVDGDVMKLANFELCQQYFKTLVENVKMHADGA